MSNVNQPSQWFSSYANNSIEDPDDEPDEILYDFLEPELAPVKPTPWTGQQVQHDRIAFDTEWNVYLHHPRGTVERIGGPFTNEAEASKEMNLQMSFGLFPESKGYRWECKEETKEAGTSE